MVAPHRVLAVVVALMACASLASAQSNPPLYVGGTLTGNFQQRSDQSGPEPLGGNGMGGSVLIGGWVSRRIGIEFEPSFGPTFSNLYSYSPYFGANANVVASRRDTFWSGQVRVRVPGVEPVFGIAYRHSILKDHATFQNGGSYYDHNVSDNGVAIVLGADAPLKVASHVDVLPTFRLVFAGGRGPMMDSNDVTDTSTGLLTLRYGAGVRVRF